MSEKVLQFYNPDTNTLETYDPSSGRLLSINNELTSDCIPYTDSLGKVISQLVLEGNTISKIASLPGMPTVAQIYNWRARLSAFKQMLDTARKDRAHYFNDIVADELASIRKSDVITQDAERRAKLVINTALKLSERDNPKEYIPSSSGPNIDNKIQVIVTGVPQAEDLPSDEGYEKVVLGRSETNKEKEKV